MRYVFMGLFVGLVVGAFLPAEPAQGAACGYTVNSHLSGLTSCAAEYEDHTVDRILNEGSPGLVCIFVNETENVADVNYYNQCESLGTNGYADYTVQVQRSTHEDPSAWNTASYIGGTACVEPAEVHRHGPQDHGEFEECID